MKLLIVDDLAANCRLLRAQLEGDGHTVVDAQNGVDALRLLRCEKVDGVISDILMPAMDGYRLCLEIRKTAALRNLPFVLYTSTYNSPGDRQLATDVGADAYISKPASVGVIVEALSGASNRRSPSSAREFAESDVLKQYNEALVRKLEDRNLSLEAMLSALGTADTRYRLVFENVPNGITITRDTGEVLSANPALARMLGYASVEEGLKALQSSANEVWIDPEDRREFLHRLLHDHAVAGFEARLRRGDGTFIWAALNGRRIPDPESDGALLVTMVVDITLEKEQQHRIARLSRIREMLIGIVSAIVRNRGDRNSLLTEACNSATEHGKFPFAFVAMLDASSQDLSPVAWSGAGVDVIDEFRLSAREGKPERGDIASEALRTKRAAVDNDITRTSRSGSSLPGHQVLGRGYRSMVALPLVVNDCGIGVFMLLAEEPGFFDAEEVVLLESLAADISYGLEHIEKSERLDYLAYYDALTGLPNRALYHDRLAHSLQRRAGSPVLVAVALLDLERFRRVNETLGRPAGDELLRVAGARLQRSNETAARVGTDLFALHFRGARSAAEVNRGLETIVARCFDEPFQLQGEEVRISCRVGVALYPADGTDADSLLRNAESALKLVKRYGERLLFYAPKMNARVAESLATETRLRRAIGAGEFVLHYQPKITIGDGRIVGVEALIRWQDPQNGLVAPGSFIPILEETGMIVEVGRWALERAMTDHAHWVASGAALPRVAVNVSAIQLHRKDFVDTIIDAIQRTGDNAEALELEITESLLMRDVEGSVRKLSILRGMGIGVAMDDFGTGYSSLSYIARLPVDTVKIDRSFIAGMTGNSEDATIVSGIIALVHSLKLRVVAEGVETKEQAQRLEGLGCDEAQGYYYSRPVLADQIEVLVRGGGVLPACEVVGHKQIPQHQSSGHSP